MLSALHKMCVHKYIYASLKGILLHEKNGLPLSKGVNDWIFWWNLAEINCFHGHLFTKFHQKIQSGSVWNDHQKIQRLKMYIYINFHLTDTSRLNFLTNLLDMIYHLSWRSSLPNSIKTIQPFTFCGKSVLFTKEGCPSDRLCIYTRAFDLSKFGDFTI